MSDAVPVIVAFITVFLLTVPSCTSCQHEAERIGGTSQWGAYKGCLIVMPDGTLRGKP